MAKNKLSIYLIKEGILFEDVFSTEKRVEVLKEYSKDKIMYYIPSRVHEPSWVNSFFKIKDSSLLQANSKVVLLVRKTIKEKEIVFAIVFGSGKSLFAEDVLEEQFGLKIVLNSVGMNDVRKIGKISIGTNQKHSQEQMPKTTNINEFGFDINRDLITNVTAKCVSGYFDKVNLTGGDIFSIAADVDIDNIETFLEKVYVKYLENGYKENFEWLDNIKELKSKKEKEELDNLLIAAINDTEFERIWLAVPEVIDWDEINGFKYNLGEDEIYDDIDFESFFESYKIKLEDIKQLKRKKVYMIDTNGEEISSWNIYKCIVAELQKADKTYCLNNGKWYVINNDFVTQINEEYEEIPICKTEFVDYVDNGNKKYTENEYNQQLAESLENSTLMHCVGEIPFGGGSGNKIEVCDVLTKNNELIHVKKNGSSSTLSHLFNQATVSAEALLDKKFREMVNQKLRDNKLELLPTEFNSSNYTVVLAIINRYKEERPKIPFFSKVSIRFTARLIKNMGYNVCIKNIRKR